MHTTGDKVGSESNCPAFCAENNKVFLTSYKTAVVVTAIDGNKLISCHGIPSFEAF